MSTKKAIFLGILIFIIFEAILQLSGFSKWIDAQPFPFWMINPIITGSFAGAIFGYFHKKIDQK